MFYRGSSTLKTIYKKINWQLKANFFTIEEFKELSFRKSYKVIKTIAKIESIKLKRSEIKNIVNFIHSDFESESKNVDLLWEFVREILKDKINETPKRYSQLTNYFIATCYRSEKFELMRN